MVSDLCRRFFTALILHSGRKAPFVNIVDRSWRSIIICSFHQSRVLLSELRASTDSLSMVESGCDPV
jgi:hypothetical protein